MDMQPEHRQRLAALNKLRYSLRDKLVLKMKTNPTMQVSEILRKLENDISFWEGVEHCSLEQILVYLKDSLQSN